MKTPQVELEIMSIYRNSSGVRVNLPKRLALPTPDTHDAILAIRTEVQARGGDLVLSDLFRSHDMQLQAALDFETGKKPGFSPRPVGSMHEAGRAFDLSFADLKLKKIPLPDFWVIAAQFGMFPILKRPDKSDPDFNTEAHHFDCPGSHKIVFDYYATKKATGFIPYKAMAMSGVMALGIVVDEFKDRQKEAALQFGLIRLGFVPGPVDGFIGKKTRGALEQAGLTFTTIDETLQAVEDQLQTKFPNEYRMIFPQLSPIT
jgi:D-alanyl-D-alanine dipeptidase